jgi:hypothetical protein
MRRIVRSEHSFEVDGVPVVVSGQSGPFQDRWRLEVDGREVVNEPLVLGRRFLDAPMPDRSSLSVEVCRAPSGSATMVVRHDGAFVTQFAGTVA